jgi:hypothetical protein
MLIELKAATPYREFQTLVSEIDIDQRQSSRLMALARNRQLLEQHKPDSQRAALALIKESSHYSAGVVAGLARGCPFSTM